MSIALFVSFLAQGAVTTPTPTPTPPGYPAITLTGPTFDTSTPITGAASLSGGSGIASGIVLPSTAFTLELNMRNRSAGSWDYTPNWITLTDSFGHTFSITDHDSWPVPYYNGSGSVRGGGGGPRDDTAVHQLCMVCPNGGTQNFYVDGNDVFFYNGGIAVAAGAATLSFNLPANTTIDNIRISDGALHSGNFTPAALTRQTSTVVLYTFDSSTGAAS